MRLQESDTLAGPPARAAVKANAATRSRDSDDRRFSIRDEADRSARARLDDSRQADRRAASDRMRDQEARRSAERNPAVEPTVDRKSSAPAAPRATQSRDAPRQAPETQAARGDETRVEDTAKGEGTTSGAAGADEKPEKTAENTDAQRDQDPQGVHTPPPAQTMPAIPQAGIATKTTAASQDASDEGVDAGTAVAASIETKAEAVLRDAAASLDGPAATAASGKTDFASQLAGAGSQGADGAAMTGPAAPATGSAPHAGQLGAATPTPHQGAPVPLGAVPMTVGLRSLSGSSHFEIRLDPVDLGRIDVKLDIDKDLGTVTTRVVVERPETLALLQRDAGNLQQALAQAGLDSSGGIDLSLRGDGASGGQGQTGERSGGKTGEDGTGSRLADPAGVQPTTDYVAPRMLRGIAGIDIRI